MRTQGLDGCESGGLVQIPSTPNSMLLELVPQLQERGPSRGPRMCPTLSYQRSPGNIVPFDRALVIHVLTPAYPRKPNSVAAVALVVPPVIRRLIDGLSQRPLINRLPVAVPIHTLAIHHPQRRRFRPYLP